MQRGRGWHGAVVAVAVITSGLSGAVTARPAAAAVSTALAQVNAAASTITLAAPGDSSVLSFQGLVGQVLTITATGGTFAAGCDATLTLRNPSGVTLGAPVCVGQSGAINGVTLGANGIFSATVVASGSSVGSLQLRVTSTATKLSITPNAQELGVVIAPGATVNLGFTAPVGRYVAASGRDNVDCLTTFRIVRPDGVDQFAPTCASGNSGVFVDQSIVAVGGTQKLRVVNTATTNRTVLVRVFAGVNATATTTIDGSTSTFTFLPAQQARVSFPVTAGQSFHVQIDSANPVTSALTCATLFTPDGTNWGRRCSTGGPGGSGTPSLPDTIADVTGTWTVLLDPLTVFTPTLSVRIVSAPDPTALVVDGTPHRYEFVTERGPLRLRTNLAAGQRVLIAGSFDAIICPVTVPDCNVVRTIFDPTGTAVGPTVALPRSSGLDSVIIASSPGTWTISLSSSIEFSLSLVASSPPDVVYDNPGPSVTSVGPGIVDQRVVVTVPGVAGRTYGFGNDAVPTTASSPIAVSVSDPSDTEIASTTNSVCSPECTPVVYTAPTTGSYRIIVTPRRGTSLPNFRFQVLETPRVTMPVTLGTASPLISTALTQDVAFTFTGTAGQKISTKALVIDYPYPGNAAVTFIRPNGTQLGALRTLGGASSTFLDPVRLDATGSWTVLIAPKCRMNTACSLQVRFANVPDVTGSLVVDRTVQPFSITAPGQVARFSFSRNAGQTFRVRFANSNFVGAAVNLTTALGTTSLLCTLNAGTLDCPLQTASVSGTYSVTVNPPGERTGSAAVGISTT